MNSQKALLRNKVILTNAQNENLGEADKMEAHQKGLLHQAFSILVYNAKGELLLQKRAKDKYHSAGLWTNTCCSHPQPSENLNDTIHERLQEEMGFDCPLNYKGQFIYETNFNNGLIEHELDMVFCGQYDDAPNPNPDEVEDFEWILPKILKQNMLNNPQDYTFWFENVLKICEIEGF